jgi:hypothetical protein
LGSNLLYSADGYKPLSEGLNWPIAILMDIAFLAILVGMFWKAYGDWKTIITEEEIIRPRLLRMRVISWSEVTYITGFGAGIHIHAPAQKIVITPYAYKEPALIIEQIYELAEKMRSSSPRRRDASK